MARYEKDDLVRLLDKENYATIGKIVEVYPYVVLGHTVRAYDIVGKDSVLQWGGYPQETVVYLDGLFESI